MHPNGIWMIRPRDQQNSPWQILISMRIMYLFSVENDLGVLIYMEIMYFAAKNKGHPLYGDDLDSLWIIYLPSRDLNFPWSNVCPPYLFARYIYIFVRDIYWHGLGHRWASLADNRFENFTKYVGSR